MMMRATFCALFWGIVFVAGARSQTITSEAVESELTQLSELGIESRVRRGRAMNPELKAAVIDAISKNPARQDADLTKQYDRLMFDLGDEETVKRFAEAYLRDSDFYGATGFPTCQNPRVIELIAPAIFREENWVAKGPYLAPSVSTAQLMVEMLGRTPGFQGEVIDWARKLPSQSTTLTDLREVVREWWRANEQFFKEGNYQAVKPGRELAKEEPKVEQPPGPPAALASTSSQQPARPSASPAVVPVAESSPSSPGLLWTAAAAAVALLVGLLVFWKRRT